MCCKLSRGTELLFSAKQYTNVEGVGSDIALAPWARGKCGEEAQTKGWSYGTRLALCMVRPARNVGLVNSDRTGRASAWFTAEQNCNAIITVLRLVHER